MADNIETADASKTANAETFAFQAEINQLLSLIINAFYSNKEIFLRELVSNASDALDKIRYLGLTNKDELSSEPKLEIRIIPDKANNVLVIEDTGIGMTKKDLIDNLGTIARSGTKGFMEALTDGKADLSLIGQFGVGFYAAYLVADRVRVVSKHNADEQHTWESTAGGSFTIAKTNEPNLPRGTRIYLHMKPDLGNYLETATVQEVVKKHNGFINYPVMLEVEKEVEVEEDVATNTDKDDAKKEEDGEIEEVKEDEDKAAEGEKKKRIEKRKEFEQVNTTKPLWTRNASDVKDEEYISFYKALTGEWIGPLAWKHFSVEGSLEFKGLLFIPPFPAIDMYDRANALRNIKLYVRRVFIMDDCKDLIPEYLAFVKGVIDSDDLPLNISREMLQQNRIMNQIKKNLVKRILDMLTEMSENDEEKFKQFYDGFNRNLKLGVHDDKVNRDKLVELLRFCTTKSSDKEELFTLKQYTERMKEGQKAIYYITGESYDAVKSSPFIEGIRAKGYEVIFMIDSIDEYMMQQLHDYKDIKFVCCTKDDELVEESEAEKEEYTKLKNDNEPFCKYLQEIVGADKVIRTTVSKRIVNTPCIVITDKYGWTANMERIMKAQALNGGNKNPLHSPITARKILEINPNHKLMQLIKSNMSDPDRQKANKDLVLLLFESAMLHSGFTVTDPNKYVNRIHRMISMNVLDNEVDADDVADEEDAKKDDAEESDDITPDEAMSKLEEVD